jgi:DNA-binding transcriptional regulator YiaG
MENKTWFVANNAGDLAGHDMEQKSAESCAARMAEQEPDAGWEALSEDDDEEDHRRQELRDLIAAAGMTQAAAAEYIGVSEKALQHWLGGRRAVPQYAINALGHVTRMSNT